jgi:hypothetical protein
MVDRFTIRILADKTGPQPPLGQPWPCNGVEIDGEPPVDLILPTSFIHRHLGASWLKVTNPRQVERPSQPNPKVVKGSAAVAPDHWIAEVPPHTFRHFDTIEFHTRNHGIVKYRVVQQPDKYVDSDDPNEPVTLEQYDAGNTRVDHYYTCVREG